MKTSYRLILGLALLAVGVSLSVAACDTLRSSTSEKDLQDTAASVDAVAYMQDGNATIVDAKKKELTSRFREAVEVAKRGSGGKNLTAMKNVSFEYAANPRRLVARAEDASGNCLLTSFYLGKANIPQEAATQGSSATDYMVLTGTSNTCTGDPCTLCQENYDGNGEFTGCSCEGEGRGGEEGFCNHSTSTVGVGG